MAEKLTVGEGYQTFSTKKDGSRGADQTTTVIEILPLPEDEASITQLVRDTFDRYYGAGRKNVNIVGGKNLADDPELAPRVEVDKIYVVES